MSDQTHISGKEFVNLTQECVARAMACELALSGHDVPALIQASEHLVDSATCLNAIAKLAPETTPHMPSMESTKVTFDLIACALNMLRARAFADDERYRAALDDLVAKATGELESIEAEDAS